MSIHRCHDRARTELTNSWKSPARPPPPPPLLLLLLLHDWLCKLCGCCESLVTYHDTHRRFALNGSDDSLLEVLPPPPSCRSSVRSQMKGRAIWATRSAVGLPCMTTAPPSPLPVLPSVLPLQGLTPSPSPRWSRYSTARNAGHQRKNLVISSDPPPPSTPPKSYHSSPPPPPPPTSLDRLS